MTSNGARVSIPANWRKMVSNIKEVAGNHSEDEIYAMLQECNMNPDETAQKLFYQDTFHEVKKKRDKRKENTRETGDPRWRPVGPGRGSRWSFSSRYLPSVATRNTISGKGDGVNNGPEKGNTSITPNTDNKDAGSSSVPCMASNTGNADHQLSGNVSVASREASNASETIKTGNTKLASSGVKNGSASGQLNPTSDLLLSTKTDLPVSGVYEADLDPVLVPSLNKRNPGDVGTIQRVIGSQRTVIEVTTKKAASCDISGSEHSSTIERRPSGTPGSYYGHGKAHVKVHSSEANQQPDTSQVLHLFPPASSTNSRPPSRSQQLGVQQKVMMLSKEWKPKSTQPNSQASGIPCVSDLPMADADALPKPSPASHSVTSEDANSVLEKRIDKLQLSDRQHVIIPNHLQVPESERHGLSFGSFDVGFKLNLGFANGPASEKSPTSQSESSQDIEESAEQLSSSIHTKSSVAQETDYSDSQPLSSQLAGNYSSVEAGMSSITTSQECNQSKEESTMATEGPQYSVVQTTPSYATLELVPPMLGSQFAPLESSESQSRGTTRVQSFVVQQPFDPSTSYYTQLYRPTADADGRFSPFLAPGGAPKYSGNVAILPGQTGQAPQESGIVSTSGSVPIASQATGVMQNSVAVPQQPHPVFRQPAGLHISHYPPNYLPYSQYYSPFYVPPPTLHHFLGSAAFPQQVPAGSVYPPPGVAAAAAPVKYPVSQYKPGTNTGNSNLVGIPTGYGTYNSSPTGYTTAAVSSSNSTSNEDPSSNQFKENNVYVTGQQSEGSAVWVQPPGRDISSSFYSISPQGQHMTFAPTQVGHGAFSGIYHPTPTVAAAPVHPLLQQSQTVAGVVEIAAPPAGVYQQSQRSQVNWAHNY